MISSERGRRGGTPSTTQPIPGPWLSPKLVKENSFPKLLSDMSDDRDIRRVDGFHANDMVAAIHMVGLAGDTG